MSINTIEEAKIYALKATNKYLSEQEALLKIEDYKRYKEIANEDSKLLDEEIAALEEWLSSETFKNGDYPQGIDELVLNLVEWRSSVYAFDEVDLIDSPFRTKQFHAQWLIGAGYATFCILGKLVSKDRRDNSLQKLWRDIHEFLVDNGTCSKEEATLLNEKFNSSGGHFTNLNSKAILFRNKVIAHNESSPRIQWPDIDSDIELLVRAWSLIVTFCSFGIIAPFSSSEVAFSGLEGTVSVDEMYRLKSKREEYLAKVKLWSRTNIFTNEVSEMASAFAELSISFSSPRSPDRSDV